MRTHLKEFALFYVEALFKFRFLWGGFLRLFIPIKKESSSAKTKQRPKMRLSMQSQTLISYATTDEQWIVWTRGQGEVNVILSTERQHFGGKRCCCSLPERLSSVELSAVLNQPQLANVASCTLQRSEKQMDGQTDRHTRAHCQRNRWTR